MRIFLEEAQQPPSGDPRVPAWILAGDEHCELERIRETELRKVFRSGQRHEHVVALQGSLESRVRVTGRAQVSPFRGAGVGSLDLEVRE
jgi:hypothetical protein